jgi:hypothetical protein
MKNRIGFVLLVLLGVSTFMALHGCGSTGTVSGDAPAISDQFRVIRIAASSGQYSDVVFSHKAHSEDYLNNNCLTCHSHSGIRSGTTWNCGGCHTGSDTEGFCPDDNTAEHGCRMVQCKNCHVAMGMGPTTACAGCHSLVSLGVFLDGPVQNLYYTTATKKGFTDSGGTFRYEPSETSITFYIGDIRIGSGTPKAVMTPLDLVPGALYETDQGVTNISRFLQTLDQDGVHGNGIRIPDNALNYAGGGRSIDFSAANDTAFGNDPGLLGFLGDLNANSVFAGTRTLVSAATAQLNLYNTLRALHTPPVAGSVGMTGTMAVSYTITGTYAYSDADGDAQYGSTYQWYRDPNPSVSGDETAISGATSVSYTTGAADEGQYLIFEVTPADRYHSGTAARSASTGPVSFDPTNSAPTASSCVIGGPRDIGGNLLANTHFLYNASYTYGDTDGDPESGSTYEWYSDVDANTGNGNETLVSSGSLFYNPAAGTAGRYIFFKVTPASSQGNPTGAPCKSAAMGPVATDNSLTAYNALASETTVDKYFLRLGQPAGVVIDVQSYEGWDISGYSHHFSYPSCYSCHGDAGGAFDLGFRSGASSNGGSNDILTSNIFLFRAGDVSNTLTYTLVDRKDGWTPGADAPGVYGAPGVSDALIARSTRNPYMDRRGSCSDAQFTNQQTCTTAYCDNPFYATQPGCEAAFYTWHPASTWTSGTLSAADYVLAVGANLLDESGAKAGSNGGGDNWGWTDTGDRSSGNVVGNEVVSPYRNYKILFTFQ